MPANGPNTVPELTVDDRIETIVDHSVAADEPLTDGALLVAEAGLSLRLHTVQDSLNDGSLKEGELPKDLDAVRALVLLCILSHQVQGQDIS